MAKKRATRSDLHYHGCSLCGRRYPDGCDQPDENRACQTCRSERLSIHHIGLEPKDCCRENSKPASKDEAKHYRLRGSGRWWICRTCYRQFGFNPGSTHV